MNKQTYEEVIEALVEKNNRLISELEIFKQGEKQLFKILEDYLSEAQIDAIQIQLSDDEICALDD